MPDSIDQLQATAEVYAHALFDLARERGRVDQVRSELEQLAALLRDEPGFQRFITSGAIDADRRAESLERMFRGRLADEVVNTLQIMNRHARVGLLPELTRAFTLAQERAAGQIEVTATTAVELSPEQRQAVERKAAALSGRTPLVSFVADPEVIGGLVLQIGDVRYDYSVRRQLVMMQRRLLDRSARGLARPEERIAGDLRAGS